MFPGSGRVMLCGISAASALGILSPLCMYGTIPLASSFSENGMEDDWLAAFMMSSILLNPQLMLYSTALGPAAFWIRLLSSFACGALAAAIALATSYLHDVQGVSEEETVVVCPVDPYVDDSYFEALKQLADQAQKGEANLVLMGIEPTYPSEKYGYIIPIDGDQTSTVSMFKEKPAKARPNSMTSQV